MGGPELISRPVRKTILKYPLDNPPGIVNT